MAVQIFERCENVAKRLTELIEESGITVPVYFSVIYEEAMNLYKKTKAKYVILDLNFPGNLSCTLVKQIKQINPRCVLIVLYNYEDKLRLEQCRVNGADHCFDKYDDFERIPVIINSGLESQES